MKRQMMKWFTAFFSVLLLSSCGFFQDNTENTDTEEPIQEVPAKNIDNPNETTDSGINQDLTAWLPRLENVTYHYEGAGNEFAEYTKFPQFNQNVYYQTTSFNGGTALVEIYEYRDEEVVRVFEKGETYFRDNFADIGTFKINQEEEILLKLPLEVGHSWESNDTTFEITSVDHEITVPAGTYKTIEVTATIEEDIIIKRYYAEGVGLVSDQYQDGDIVIESNLREIEKDTVETINLEVYVADDQAMGMDIIDATLELETNAPARVAMEELFTGKNENFPEINILPEGTDIQYLFLNNDRIVEVDLSEEFEQMNAGSTGELFYIFNLVNTLSSYYGTTEVLLTVNGEPYTGGHMALSEGETLQFNQEMVNE